MFLSNYIFRKITDSSQLASPSGHNVKRRDTVFFFRKSSDKRRLIYSWSCGSLAFRAFHSSRWLILNLTSVCATDWHDSTPRDRSPAAHAGTLDKIN